MAADSNKNQPPLEDKRFQASSIPLALEVLLMEIDRFKQIILHSREIEKLTASRRSDYAMPSRDRRQLDAAIDVFWEDAKDKAGRRLREVGMIDDEADPAEFIYPMTKQETVTWVDIVLRNVRDECLK